MESVAVKWRVVSGSRKLSNSDNLRTFLLKLRTFLFHQILLGSKRRKIGN